MTQKEDFVKSQDTILSKKKAHGTDQGATPPGTPGPAGPQRQLAGLRDEAKNLGLDILAYLWHAHADTMASRTAVEGFSPGLYEGRARKLADALLAWHGMRHAGTVPEGDNFFNFMGTRGFGVRTGTEICTPLDLPIRTAHGLGTALDQFRELSVLAGQAGILEEQLGAAAAGKRVSPELPVLLAEAERRGSAEPPGLVTPGVTARLAGSLVLNALEPGRRRIPTGYSELDRVLGGGLYRGGLNLVLGRPGEGKTLLLTNIAANKLREGFAEGIAIFSLEMSGEEIASRVFRASSGHGEDLSTYLTDAQAALHDDIGSLPAGQRDTARRARETWERFHANPFYLLDGAEREWDIDSIISVLGHMHARGTLPALVMIDYFQLICPPAGTDRRVPRHERLEEVCGKLARFCLARPECCVLLLTQARRGEARSRNSAGWASLPGTEDISQCDAVAHKARCIMSIARLPEPPKEDEGAEEDGDDAPRGGRRSVRKASRAEIEARHGEHPADFFHLSITKNREGRGGVLLVKAYGEFCKMLVAGEAHDRQGPTALDVNGWTDDDFYTAGGRHGAQNDI